MSMHLRVPPVTPPGTNHTPSRVRALGWRSGTGYTFIELITVMVLVVLLLAISVVAMAPGLMRSKVHNAANVVAGDLQYAQVLAVRHRRPIAFIVVSASRQYIVRDRDDPTNVYRTRSLGSDSDFSLDQFTASPSMSVELYPNGVARQTTTFTLELNGYSRDVLLTRGGQIRILR